MIERQSPALTGAYSSRCRGHPSGAPAAAFLLCIVVTYMFRVSHQARVCRAPPLSPDIVSGHLAFGMSPKNHGDISIMDSA